MTDDVAPKGLVDALAFFAWRPSPDEAAAYAQAALAAKCLPASAVTADVVLAALALREQRVRAAVEPIPFENPLDAVFNRAARNGGDLSAEVEANMRADRLRALREKDQQTE